MVEYLVYIINLFIFTKRYGEDGQTDRNAKSANKQFIGQMARPNSIDKGARAHEKNIQITENE